MIDGDRVWMIDDDQRQRTILCTEEEKAWYMLQGKEVYRAVKLVNIRLKDGSYINMAFDTDHPREELAKKLNQ